MTELKAIKFYHGTNSIFLESIKSNGLGKYNIVNESNGVELLSKLNKIAKSRLKREYSDYSPNNDYGIELTIDLIISQQNGSGINWSHGDVYITPSYSRASRYAINNKFGSELFTHIALIIDFLNYHNIKEANNLLNEYPIVKDIISKEGQPIIIEVNNLNTNEILDEGGYSADNQIKLLKYFDPEVNKLSFEDGEGITHIIDDFGFRLNKSLPYIELIIHYLKTQEV